MHFILMNIASCFHYGLFLLSCNLMMQSIDTYENEEQHFYFTVTVALQ
jgi:hypothetical protein